MNNSDTETPEPKLAQLLNGEAYDLAALAAQLMPRQASTQNAVEAACELLGEAQDKLRESEVVAPENIAAWADELRRQRSEYFANLHLTFEEGVRAITCTTGRWETKDKRYGALGWFKRFLQAKAAKQEQTPDKAEARAEAWLANYRQRGFTGTEGKKLQDEFNAWRNKGKKGHVKKKRRDGRLREEREARKARQVKQGAKQAREAWQKLTGAKLQYEAMDEAMAESGKGKKNAHHA